MLGVGIDIEIIKRFKKYSLENDIDFLETIYTNEELEYCFLQKFPERHLAVRFCAKEAYIKALPEINQDVKFNEINIVKQEKGKPQINCEKFPNQKCHLSLSHEKDKAIAIVYIEEI